MSSLIKKAFFLFLGVSTFNLYAQEKFDTYENTYVGKTYEIMISSKEPPKYTLFIDALSIDKLHDKGGIMITNNLHESFIEAISQAKIKYLEWVKTAKENNVKELDKTMSIKTSTEAYFQYGGWNYDFDVTLKFDFKVIESKGLLKYLLIIRTGELESSSNQFMKTDGFLLVFNSSNEIDTFIDKISTQKINAFINKPKTTDLFKD